MYCRLDYIHDKEEFTKIADGRVGECPEEMLSVFHIVVKECLKTLSKRPRSYEVHIHNYYTIVTVDV